MRSLIRFLTSVKLAIVLLILLALASVLGTLVPQGRTPGEYAARYGGLAPLLQSLQITRLYHSLWFSGLLTLFGLNIAVCTLTRLGAKLRRAFRPRIETEAKALAALALRDRIKRPEALAASRASLERALRSAGFRVRSSTGGSRVHLLARKRAAGHFGSDVVHLGLLVILAGAVITGAAGVRTELALAPGETRDVAGAGFALRLDDFSTEYYPGGAVKAWKSAVTVIENGRPARRHVIAVNHPLVHRGFSFYQMSYGTNWDAPEVEIWARKKSDPAFLRKLSLRPGREAPLGGADEASLALIRFLPDFVLGEDNVPETRTWELRNPAARIELRGRGGRPQSSWIFANYPDFAAGHGAADSDWIFELKNARAPQFSVIEAARDPGRPWIWAGCALLMAGLALAFYWPPREIRAWLEEAQGRTEIMIGGAASKSRERFAAEFAAVLDAFRRSS